MCREQIIISYGIEGAGERRASGVHLSGATLACDDSKMLAGLQQRPRSYT